MWQHESAERLVNLVGDSEKMDEHVEAIVQEVDAEDSPCSIFQTALMTLVVYSSTVTPLVSAEIPPSPFLLTPSSVAAVPRLPLTPEASKYVYFSLSLLNSPTHPSLPSQSSTTSSPLSSATQV